jgi:hypothetical protein
MSYFPGMQKGNLDSAKSDTHGKIKKETVALQGISVTRVTFDVGAKWSSDLKDYAGTDSCKLPHVALVLSGTLRVVMDDGSAVAALATPGKAQLTAPANPPIRSARRGRDEVSLAGRN